MAIIPKKGVAIKINILEVRCCVGIFGKVSLVDMYENLAHYFTVLKYI